ncbi:uncharacterized protein LOC122721919 [Manihot esculenta]|uniref:Uncharacterized protein n=2 Tax=Manihot esculenta TaxID=3983 RepID=A0ACB7I8Z9_MANES|nr:uncharacterized protein LOC122721919 [Manihot esculenta]KAG8659561.1 hypothetical protein MANES_02G049400v8 [Manihot esculenta]
MERTGKIIRRSIYTLLKDFDYYTTNPIILLLPFSASVLLFQSCSQTKSIFLVARISLLDLNLCQVILSYVFNLPFALTSLMMAKASIILYLDHHNHHKRSVSSLYKPLVLTYLCNTVQTIIISTATFLLLVFASNFVENLLGLSSRNPLFVLASRVVFCMVLSDSMIIGNLAVAVAGVAECTGYKAIYRACLIKKATHSMALLLAFSINLGLAAIASLFQYRVARAYHLSGRPNVSMVVEGWLICNMFSLLIALDTIASCLIIKSYESDHFGREQEGVRSPIEIFKEDSRSFASSQRLKALP